MILLIPMQFDTELTQNELQGRTEKVGDDLDGESRRRESKGTYECCAAVLLFVFPVLRGTTFICTLTNPK